MKVFYKKRNEKWYNTQLMIDKIQLCGNSFLEIKSKLKQIQWYLKIYNENN